MTQLALFWSDLFSTAVTARDLANEWLTSLASYGLCRSARLHCGESSREAFEELWGHPHGEPDWECGQGTCTLQVYFDKNPAHEALQKLEPVIRCGLGVLRRLVRQGAEGAGSILQIGSALANALYLDQLLELVLDTFCNLARATGGKLVVFRHGSPHRSLEFGTRNQNSNLYLPLVRHEEIIGHLELCLDGSGSNHTAEKLHVLRSFASQAGMAIENVLTYEQEKERAREAQLLYKAARQIEEGSDLEEVLDLSSAALAQVAEVNRCLIFLRDEQKPHFNVVAATGLSEDQEEFFSAFRLPLSHFPEHGRAQLEEGRAYVHEGESTLDRLLEILPSKGGSLFVPLMVKARLIGLIYLDDSRGGVPISESSIRLVETLSLQVANAIQRASLLTQLQENLGPLKALYNVSTAITGTLSLSKVVKLIVEQTVDLLDHSACALLVLDEIGEGFRLETSLGLSDELLEPALQARIARTAVEKKRAVALYLDKDAECEPFADPLKHCQFGGVLSVPLVARKKMVGVLNCFVPPGLRFRQQEIRFLRGFANQAAIAVENARLHGLVRFKMGELGTLFEVSKAVTSTLQLDRVLEEIVRHVREILRADASSLMLLEGNYLILKSHAGVERKFLTKPIPIGQGVAGLAAKTGQPMILVDQKDGTDDFPANVRRLGLQTILCVPVETRGRVIGLINVYYREMMTHTPAQINLLVALGSQAAVAIENARLYADKERVTELLRNALIPKERLDFPGLEVGHRFLPSMDLSGDYYDLIPLGPSKCALIIADVSGKGPDAAIHTMQAKHVLKSYALAGYTPSQSLRMLNDQVGRDLQARQVSVFYAEADLAQRKMRFACAGHEPPVFWSSPQDELRLLVAEGILIGAIPDFEYQESEIDIPEGSYILLYTDGVTEARNPKGDLFGLDRILQVVTAHKDQPPQKLVNSLYTRVRKFSREKISDDLSVLAVKF